MLALGSADLQHGLVELEVEEQDTGLDDAPEPWKPDHIRPKVMCVKRHWSVEAVHHAGMLSLTSSSS